jgi:hypothetical protein
MTTHGDNNFPPLFGHYLASVRQVLGGLDFA